MDDLPDRAYTEPWRVGDAGPPGWRARRDPLWTTPMRGVRLWALADAGTARNRVLTAAAGLSDVAMGEWAAAHLLGATDLDGLTPGGRPLPLPVTPGRSGRCTQREGLAVRRSALADGDLTVVDGVLVTSPVRTAFDLARRAPDLRWAVADVDALLRARPDLRPQDVAAYATARLRWHGAARALDAARLADRRSRSRPESWMRVVWVMDAGLPAPAVNAPVHHGRGELLAIPDLLDLATGLVGEYDGHHHRTGEQQHADAVRAEQMASAALTIVRASAADLGHHLLLAQRLRTGQHRARTTPRGTWWVPPSALAA